jgi:hypothetical protein
MNCSRCGNVLSDQAVYCSQCGAPTRPDVNEPVRVDVNAFVEEVLQTQNRNSISSYLSRSWRLVCSDYWTFFLATLVATLCMGIPILSFIVMGGVSYYYLGKIRNQYRKLEDIFIGFQRQTVQLILAGLVQTLIIIALLIPLGIAWGICMTIVGILNIPPEIMFIAGGGFYLLFYVAIVCISVLWIFSFPLIIDRNLRFWDAMEISRRVIFKRFFPTLGLFIVIFLLSMAGLCCCYLGIFFVLPFLCAAMSYAYEDIFGGVSSEHTLQVTV